MGAPKGNTYAKGNKGGGRKSTYKKEYAELAYNYCLLGATDEQLAEFLGTGETTINKWKKDYKEFREALKKGKVEADAKVARSLYNRALGYSFTEEKTTSSEEGTFKIETVKHYPADPTSMIFWLKNRQPILWRDKQQVDATINEKEPMVIEKDAKD